MPTASGGQPIAFVYQAPHDPMWFYRFPNGTSPDDLNCGFFTDEAAAAAAARLRVPDCEVVFATPVDAVAVRDPDAERIRLIQDHLALLTKTHEERRRHRATVADMARTLRDLLAWSATMGGWDAPCWMRARRALRHATERCDPDSADRPPSTRELLDDIAFADQGWTDHTKHSLLIDFLDAATASDPVIADRL